MLLADEMAIAGKKLVAKDILSYKKMGLAGEYITRWSQHR
jgi:hypothetical protein